MSAAAKDAELYLRRSKELEAESEKWHDLALAILRAPFEGQAQFWRSYACAALGHPTERLGIAGRCICSIKDEGKP